MGRADGDGRQAPVRGAAAGQVPHQTAPVSARFLQMRIITWVRKEQAVGELQATGGRCVCAVWRCLCQGGRWGESCPGAQRAPP